MHYSALSHPYRLGKNSEKVALLVHRCTHLRNDYVISSFSWFYCIACHSQNRKCQSRLQTFVIFFRRLAAATPDWSKSAKETHKQNSRSDVPDIFTHWSLQMEKRQISWPNLFHRVWSAKTSKFYTSWKGGCWHRSEAWSCEITQGWRHFRSWTRLKGIVEKSVGYSS